MDIEVLKELLMAIAPTLINILVLAGILIKMLNTFKDFINQLKSVDKDKKDKLNKSFDDIAKLQTKIDSIEQYLINEKENK